MERVLGPGSRRVSGPGGVHTSQLQSYICRQACLGLLMYNADKRYAKPAAGTLARCTLPANKTLLTAPKTHSTCRPQPSSQVSAPLDARAASAPNLAGPAPSSPSASSPSSSSQPGASPRPPLLSPSPLMTLAGHKADILDLAWSRCRLLLTASADTTARLWTVEAAPGECLRAFPHPDFVTSCAFHPRDPKLIATGCADGKVGQQQA